MQDISGNVTGKIQFKIDKPSWDNLDKFSKKLTAIKRQMGGLDKTIKVQQVVNQIKTVGDKVAKASVVAKKKEYSGHIVEYQKYQQQMNKMYDRAIAEDRRRDNQKIRQAEAFNKQQLRSDIARDRAESRMRGGRDSNYDVKAQRYIETKMLQARVAGVSVKDQSSLSRTFNDLRMASAASQDFAELKHRMQSVTKEMISSSREARRNAVTFGSLRGELVQLTAAYTAFTAIQSIAKDAMELEGLRAAARTFAGTDAGVASHMTFIANEAERLGTNLLVSTKEFTKFAISTKGKVGENAARNIFSGVSEYAAVLQADPQQFERAFRAINQMLSKGNLMAEEVRGQLGESLFGSIPILAQAYGFSADQKGEAAFFKAMERGELAATEDKFLAFAKGLSVAANANGALEAVTKKTRAEMNRFFADILKAKDTIFQSGMGEGIAHMFGSLSDTLQQLEPTTKAFGAAFKGAITMMTQAVRVALFPLEVFQDLLVKIGANSGVTSAKGLWTLVGSGGAFFLMTSWLYRIGKALGFVNISLATTGLMFAKVMAAALVLQDIWVGVQGGDSYSKDFANAAAIAPRWMDFIPAVAIAKMYQAQYGGSKVEITVKDSELSKVIEAKVADGSQKQQAALRSDDGG